MNTEARDHKINAILIGGSAGSLQVIVELVKQLKPSFSIPIVLILHRKPVTDSVLKEVLTQYTTLSVEEVDGTTMIEPGTIYLAPPDYHVLFEDENSLNLDFSEKVNFSRPSIDVTFKSGADVLHKGILAVLLSGANADGAEGVKYVKKNGGLVWIQNPETAVTGFMPNQVKIGGDFDVIFEAQELGNLLNRLK